MHWRIHHLWCSDFKLKYDTAQDATLNAKIKYLAFIILLNGSLQNSEKNPLIQRLNFVGPMPPSLTSKEDDQKKIKFKAYRNIIVQCISKLNDSNINKELSRILINGEKSNIRDHLRADIETNVENYFNKYNTNYSFKELIGYDDFKMIKSDTDISTKVKKLIHKSASELEKGLENLTFEVESPTWNKLICNECNMTSVNIPCNSDYYCKNCNNYLNFTKINIPYSCKLLFQELQTMSIVPRYIVKVYI